MRKSAKPGRLELLEWVNKLCESDYPRIESLSDGVAYAQILDMLHPRTIPLSRIVFLPRSIEDNAKNLRMVADALNKIKAKKPLDISKLSQGKFAEHMDLVQWMYSYFQKNQSLVKGKYSAYTKRLEAYKRQKKIPPEKTNFEVVMSEHLIPNDPDLETQDSSIHEQRLNQLKDLVSSLEQELTNQVSNYKLLQEDIQQVEEERNFYFQKLRQIEIISESNPHDPITESLMQIISETPEDFLTVDK